MKLSARNHLEGRIVEIKRGAVMAAVTVDIGGGRLVRAAILMELVEDLDLKIGDEVRAVVKSTDVMIAKG